MNICCIQMVSQLISIPGWDSKSRTISILPLVEAQIKGVSLIIEFNSINDLKPKYYEIIKFKFYE